MLPRPLTFICVLFALCAASAPTEAQAPTTVAGIRARYDRIEAATPKLRRVQLTDDEGADMEILAFYDGYNIRKITYRGLADGDPIQQFFFYDKRLIFVYDQRYPDSNLRRPSRQNRFYFARGKLIRWVDATGNLVQPGSAAYRDYERRFKRAGDYWLHLTAGLDYRTLDRGKGIVEVK